MRYTVRSADGQLDFPSRKELFGAYTQGLVGPDDEVREEGSTAWRKVAALLGARPQASSPLPVVQMIRVGMLVIVGGIALSMLVSGDLRRMGLGAILALVLAIWTWSWTRTAFAIKRDR
jgi:hypothetical protein